MTDAFKCDIIEKNERKTDMAGDFGFDPTSAEKDYYFISYRNVDQERIAPIVRKLYVSFCLFICLICYNISADKQENITYGND